MVALALAWTAITSNAGAQGLLVDDTKRPPSVILGSSSFIGQLPQSIDLSTKRFPKAGNQGTQVSCVAWAVAYAMKTYYEAAERQLAPESDDLIFSPAYVFNRVKAQPSCFNGGAYFERALELVKQEGVATLAEFPYIEGSCDALPSEPIRASAGRYRISDYYQVGGHNDPNVIKGHLANGDPVLIGMQIDNKFQRWEGPSVYKGPLGAGFGHAMVVVGYSEELQAFRVINSYGTKWGDNGYIWISYGAFKDPKVLLQAWIAKDVSTVLGAGPGASRLDPDIRITIASLQHNMALPDKKLGMRLDVRVVGQNIFQRTVSVVARFWHAGRQWGLVAAGDQKVYVDAQGQVAVAMDDIRNASGPDIDRTIQLYIPYDAINLPPSENRDTLYQLEILTTAYLDRLPLAKSDGFPVRLIR